MNTSVGSAPFSAAFSVTGVGSEHCAGVVRDAVAAVPGVTGVDVEVGTGLLTVRADGPVDDAAVTAAVTGAGYGVSPAAPEAPAAGPSCCGSCH